MRVKSEIVKELIERLPPGIERPPVRSATMMWFFNISESGGLRLTPQGYQVMRMIKEPSWEIEVSDPKILKNNKMLLALDKKLAGLYYVDKKKLILFNSQEALLASLYADLPQFLENYQG